MSSALSEDERARRAAQRVFDRPLLLEAGAGTGKTTTLVARILSWCLGTGWQRTVEVLPDDGHDEHEIAAETLQGVVAITFTEAAAAEMAARLAAGLAQIIDAAEQTVIGFDPASLPDGVDAAERRRRAGHLLGAFDHLTVGTIHAFCYGLLKTYSLEARLHPELTVDAEGRELEAIGRLAVEQWVQRAYSAGEDTPFLALAARGIGPDRLLEAVLRWLTEGPSIGVLAIDPLAPERVEGFLADLGRAVDRLLELAGGRLDELPRDRLAVRVEAALDETGERLAAADDATEGTALDPRIWLELWPGNLLDRLSDWGRGRLRSKEEQACLGDLDGLAPAATAVSDRLRTIRALDPALLEAARRAMIPMLEQIEAEMRSRGVITFSGLLRETLALLERSPTVLERERRRIRLLLVDEFQDTDSVQSRIVRLLALEGEERGRPSLFVVGDPKQSIYAWRNADLAAYEAFEEALLAARGERHVLSRNFRSVPAVLAEVERVVEPVMRYRHGVQPAFHGLESTRRDCDGDADFHPVEYWVSWQPATGDGRLQPTAYSQAQEIEAEAVAADIRRLHERHDLPWSRFAVLFRKSGSQPAFLDALRRADVPFAVTRDRNYYQRREIIEAAAWIRAIVNPNDHLALVTVLRSATVGVPDAALVPLWQQALPRLATEIGGPRDPGPATIREAVESAATEVPPGIPGIERLDGWPENLIAGLAALGRLRRCYRSEPADRFVRCLRTELLIEVSEATRFQGKFRLANLGRFFRRLESALESDEADVHAVLRVLRLGVMEGREAEEATPRDAAEDAVQVMTIHTAKGLEFDHVYLVQLHTGTRSGGDELLEIGEAEPGRWAYHLFGAPTPGYSEVEAHRASSEAAEAVRTLYVAMTRAADRLVLVGSWPETIAPKDPDDARSYVDLVQNRRHHPESLLELANDPRIALEGHFESDGIRWRFPGGEHSFTGGRRSASGADWLPAPAAFDQLVRANHQRRRTARERMQRPWTEAVTGGISERLERLAITFVSAESDRPELHPEARRAARRIGTEIHRCLERWDLGADPAEEAERQRRQLLARLEDRPEEVRRAAVERLDRIASGELLARLLELAPQVVGRELPVLLEPTEGEMPLGCLSGAIDLLYRDPESGELVVADFKTDRIEASELAARATVYRPQEARYARAVRQAFALERSPRTELWFLWPDRLWTADDESPTAEDP